MAIKFIAKSSSWIGISSDVKPVSGVQEGTTCHYVDTGEEFIFHDGMWEDDLRVVHNVHREV